MNFFLDNTSVLGQEPITLGPLPWAPDWVYFTQGEDFTLTTELSQKVHYSHNQRIKDGVNKAILLMWIKEALFSK